MNQPRILITIEITDPETVESYSSVDDAILFDDLLYGGLVKLTSLVSRENDPGERLPAKEESGANGVVGPEVNP